MTLRCRCKCPITRCLVTRLCSRLSAQSKPTCAGNVPCLAAQQPLSAGAAAAQEGKRRSALLDKVLAMFPPRLHRWFLDGWSEPVAPKTSDSESRHCAVTALKAFEGHVLLSMQARHGAERFPSFI